MSTPRRFPPPWSFEEHDACFIVRDRNHQTWAYVNYEDEAGAVPPLSCSPKTRRDVSKQNIAKLPEFLRRPE
jgi:hypothetical protein